MRLAPLLLLLALLLSVPAGAVAQDCVAPQGTSAVDEYCETVPGARGDHNPGSGGGGAGISNATAGALAARGATGQALARSLGADVRKGRARKGGRDVAESSAAEVPSSNPFSVVPRALGSGSTVGDLFVLALVAIVLAMVGAGWVGFRRGVSG